MFQMQSLKLSLGDGQLDRPVRKSNALDASILVRCYINWVVSAACYNLETRFRGKFMDLCVEGSLFGPLLHYQIL
jgi:hypothetical protein